MDGRKSNDTVLYSSHDEDFQEKVLNLGLN